MTVDQALALVASIPARPGNPVQLLEALRVLADEVVILRERMAPPKARVCPECGGHISPNGWSTNHALSCSSFPF